MKKSKIFFFICIFIIFNSVCFSNDNYSLSQINIQDFSCDYDIEKQVHSIAKLFLEKNDLENFLVNKTHMLNLGETKGYIIFVEFSEGIMPFRGNYLIELYFDELNNYIKAEFLSFNASPQDRKNYPIDIEKKLK